ncbi:MAG: type II toxin-antitoxin system RelE/ParE family toxin [Deltaproteobacteria bacterium]|nr:type II toxin-antitoxin system RelE/ParE family toxin [Deltaproteobacteria bacterium]
MHELLISGQAERDMKRLDAQVFHRVAAEMSGLSANPRPAGCRKLSGPGRDWRIRVGDYRVIYEIDDAAKAVRIMRVRHRSEVYR